MRFVYDSTFDTIWAPETEIGNEAALPTDTKWKEYVWTGSEVDEVRAIGLEFYQRPDDSATIWIDRIKLLITRRYRRPASHPRAATSAERAVTTVELWRRQR